MASAPPVAVDTTPAQLAGDRADAIAHDVVLHPPLKPVAPKDAFRLLTTRRKLGGLLDRSVHGVENSEVGRVIDVMIGDDGHPAALELEVGGFMGVGNRKIAVAWGLFDLSKPEGTDPLRVALTEAQVKSAPAAEDQEQVTVVTGADLAAAPASAMHKPAASSSPTPSSPAPGSPAAGAPASPPAAAAPSGPISPGPTSPGPSSAGQPAAGASSSTPAASAPAAPPPSAPPSAPPPAPVSNPKTPPAPAATAPPGPTHAPPSAAKAEGSAPGGLHADVRVADPPAANGRP